MIPNPKFSLATHPLKFSFATEGIKEPFINYFHLAIIPHQLKIIVVSLCRLFPVKKITKLYQELRKPYFHTLSAHFETDMILLDFYRREKI